MAMTPPRVSDFHPPYRLGAFGSVLVGTWDGAPDLPPVARPELEPLRWLGRPLGAALVLRYDRPSVDHPVAYSEIIFAHVVRRRCALAVLPFDLVLDDAFFVEAGVVHYHLPKRLDASLRVTVERDAAGRPMRASASAVGLAYEGCLEPVGVPCVTPVASVLTRLSTRLLPILGAASSPLLRATIAVAPDARPAYAVRDATLVSGKCRLRPLAALYWPSLAVTVGVPRSLALGG